MKGRVGLDLHANGSFDFFFYEAEHTVPFSTLSSADKTSAHFDAKSVDTLKAFAAFVRSTNNTISNCQAQIAEEKAAKSA